METKESHIEPSPIPCQSECLGRNEQCPLCGGDNRCRVAKGHLYKGPCWCQQIIVPNHILSRLAADRLEPACLCCPCLEAVARISQGLDDTDAILAEISSLLEKGLQVLPRKQFWVNPDCGLKTRGWSEVERSLTNMVAATLKTRMNDRA